MSRYIRTTEWKLIVNNSVSCANPDSAFSDPSSNYYEVIVGNVFFKNDIR